MLSPMMISMPFKLMLFVLVDGWTLLVGSLAASFVTRLFLNQTKKAIPWTPPPLLTLPERP